MLKALRKTSYLNDDVCGKFGVGLFKSCILTDSGGSLLQTMGSHVAEINYFQEAILPNDSQWEKGRLKNQLDNL